jgi:acyl-CoA thioester hydrolase
MERFSLTMEIRIDWSELDALGHVNNLAVLKYIQAARVNYLEAIGLMQSQAQNKMGPILASTSCQFVKPLFYPGRVAVHSKADEVRNTSFRINHLVCNEAHETAAEAQDIIVVYDFQRRCKLPIPEDLKARIDALENRSRTFSAQAC